MGVNCTRVDELHFSKSILSQIYNGIKKADFIIADMTDNNPNVYYEIGYAHALGKEVILISQKNENIPFDFSDMNRIEYDEHNLSDLMAKLKDRISFIIRSDYLSKT